MTKHVVLSCTTNSVYDFFLPIAVRIWKNRTGYTPCVILVGNEKDWSSGHSQVVHREVRERERVEFFPMLPDLPESTVSMGLRQHAAALEFDPDDLLLIGDVDLFPVHRGFYHRYDPEAGPVGVYYAEMYQDEYWPAYGVTMPVKNWREVMGITPGDFRGSVERGFLEGGVLELVKAHRANGLDTRFWFFDEKYATSRIRASRFSSGVVKFSSFVDEKTPLRTKIRKGEDVTRYVDFHCSRPGWNGENWPPLRHALSQMIPDDLQWLDQYVKAYRSAL